MYRDLAQLYAGPVAPGGRAVHDFVRRLHDAGLEHRDLNLGNVLGRIGPGGVWELFVVDLDRARWHGRPVAPAARARVEARLLRSWRKLFPGAPPFGGDWNR